MLTIARNKLLVNSSYAVLTSVAVRAVNVIVFILIARLLGPAAAGVFTLCLTYLIIFSVATWGMDEYMVRQVASQPGSDGRYFVSFLILRTLLVVISYALLVILVAKIVHYPAATITPILIIGLAIIPDNLGNVGQSVLVAHERFQIPLVSGILGGTTKLILSLLALSGGYGLVGISWSWVVGSVISAIILLVYASRTIIPVQPGELRDGVFWRQTLVQLPPFFLLVFFVTLEYQLDVILLSIYQDETQVGWYGAVTTIIAALILPAQGYRAAVYPVMTRYWKEAPERLKPLYKKSMYYLGAASIPMAFGLAIVSPGVIKWLYGPAFYGAVIPLQIMAFYLILNYLNVPNTRITLVQDRQKRLVWLLVASLSLNLVLNLVLDAQYGASGAAIARLASALLLFVPNYAYVSRQLLRVRTLRMLYKPVIAALVMALGGYFAYQHSMWLAITVSIIIYAGVLYLLNGFRYAPSFD